MAKWVQYGEFRTGKSISTSECNLTLVRLNLLVFKQKTRTGQRTIVYKYFIYFEQK